MALINLGSVVKRVTALIKKADPDQGMEILTYKRNRGVEILKTAAGLVALREWGYHEESWQGEEDKVAKLLKTILKREFPRSRKVRIYHLNCPEDRNQPRPKI